MWLKNNSSNEWLNYDCGCCVIDIHAYAELEVPENVGLYILKRLGHSNWITDITQTRQAEQHVSQVVQDKPSKPKQKKVTKKAKKSKKKAKVAKK